MLQENEFDKLEHIRAVSSGLDCLADIMDMIDNVEEKINQKDFAEILRALSFTIANQTQQAIDLLTNKH